MFGKVLWAVLFRCLLALNVLCMIFLSLQLRDMVNTLGKEAMRVTLGDTRSHLYQQHKMVM